MGVGFQEEARLILPLRLRGGGGAGRGSQKDKDEDWREEGVEEGQELGRGGDPTTSVAGPSTRLKPGPRSSKEKGKRELEKVREESRSRERDRRRDLEQSEENLERDRSCTRDKKSEEDEDVQLVEEEPPQPNMDMVQELTRVSRETRRKALDTTVPDKVKAIIRSVEILRVADARQESQKTSPSSRASSTGRTESTGRKRSRQREEDNEEMESEDGGETQDSTPPSPSKGRKKRKKDGSIETRGRPAKDSSHAGEFTAEWLEEKRREKEDKQMKWPQQYVTRR